LAGGKPSSASDIAAENRGVSNVAAPCVNLTLQQQTAFTFAIAETTKASTVVGIDPSVGYLEYARAHNTYAHVFLRSGMRRNFPMTMVLSTAAYRHW
jgi:hypothetical protein